MKKIVRRWLDLEPQPESDIDAAMQVSIKVRESNDLHVRNSTQFCVHAAQGGHVIEFRKYDPVKDSNDQRLYIIQDDMEFSEELAKIVYHEMLTS